MRWGLGERNKGGQQFSSCVVGGRGGCVLGRGKSKGGGGCGTLMEGWFLREGAVSVCRFQRRNFYLNSV